MTTAKPKPFTHTAWVFKTEGIRKGRRVGRWINEGDARIDPNGDGDLYLHSTPVGGFNGHVHFTKIGGAPPDAPTAPHRPDDHGDGDDEEAEG